MLDERTDTLLELAGVQTKISGYSRGMKQRSGIAEALVNAPLLLLLDEPTSALDPIGRKDVLDLLVALRGRTTVFFSAQILSDIEGVCDTVAILDRGRVVVQAPIEELKARYGVEKMMAEVASGADEFADAISVASGGIEVAATVLQLPTFQVKADRGHEE